MPETQPDGKWPESGRVEYRNYSTKYRPELELVLKDISFSIKAGEKVFSGIVSIGNLNVKIFNIFFRVRYV